VLIKLLHGKAREIHWLMYITSLLFVVAFVLPSIQAAIG
jgi:AGZA family xanthine/uracil permease-like MFS transporter